MLNTAAWQGDAAPFFDPLLPAPLPEQRRVGRRRPRNLLAPVSEPTHRLVAARATPAEHDDWQAKTTASWRIAVRAAKAVDGANVNGAS